MSNSKKALVYVNYPQNYQKKLLQTLEDIGYTSVSVLPDGTESHIEQAKDALQYVDIAILGGPLPKEDLENAPNLKWIHFDWVGIEGVLTEGMFTGGRKVTNGSGRNSICLAEHVFFFMFTLSYGTREIFASQDATRWGVDHVNPYTCLFGKTMLIVGTGSIGKEVANRAKTFGMKTVGYSRTKKPIDTVYDVQVSKEEHADFPSLTREADYIVLAVPLNTETYHLIDKTLLEGMKNTAYLINISRGAVIDEKALEAALKSNQIAGAGCDTFEKEPLPPSSGLWECKNLVITPHSTPQSPLKFDHGISVVVQNLKNLETGENLLNQQSLSDLMHR